MKRKALAALATLGICLSASAQLDYNPEFMKLLQEDHTRAGINTNSYEFEPLSDTKAPKGYKPFYISHYGRHGSRSDWGGPVYEGLVKSLEAAKAEGILTSDGESLLEEARMVSLKHDGMNGRLTPRGVHEHAQLAERMYNRYRRVFRKGSHKIRSVSSTVQRCIISMNGFTNRLSALDPKLDISLDTGEKMMEYINNSCPADVQRETGKLLDSLRTSYVPDTLYTLNMLFTDPKRGAELCGGASALQWSIFSTARVADPFEIDRDVFRYLPDDAIYHIWEYFNMDLYLRQCNSVEFGLRRTPESEPLVQDIVTKADEAIATGEYAADLRFGHDFPILSLAGYLGLEGVGDRLTFEEARKGWFGPANVPFAANLQMIFYRNRKGGDILVKFLYDEKETKIRGLDSYSGPYYRWEDVKANIKGYLR